MRVLRILAAAWLTVLLAPAAQAAGRVALVIGNAGYTAAVGPLRNPKRDAELIAATLKARGFEVILVEDASRVALLGAVDRYARRLAAAGSGAIGFFYYSGHGTANPADGRNYIVPIDVATAADDRLWYESVPLPEIIHTITATARGATNIVVFDACRDALELPRGGKGLGGGGKGLMREPEADSTLIAFSTSPNAIAADADATAATGPYATELAAQMGAAGVDVKTMFDNVKFGVFRRTGRKQLPWVEDGLSERVFLNGKQAAMAAVVVAAATPTHVSAVMGPEGGGSAPQVASAHLIATTPTVATGAGAGAGAGRWGLSPRDLLVAEDRDMLVRSGAASRLADIKSAATGGDATAALLTGLAYANGVGTTADDAEALDWYQRAASAGVGRAKNNLGSMYARGAGGVLKDEAKGTQLMLEAAQAGDTDGMISIAMAYYRGFGGLPADTARALDWLRKGSEAGRLLSDVLIGDVYASSKGKTADFPQALEWYRRAAAAGDATGMARIGGLYDSGKGLQKDDGQALQWYRKAAAAASPSAMNSIGVFYQDGRGVSQDNAQALEWYRKSADGGFAPAFYNIGMLYYQGKADATDAVAAGTQTVVNIRKAADGGYTLAMVKLAELYDLGIGNLPKDQSQRLVWLTRAAERGSADAMLAIGYGYYRNNTDTSAFGQDYKKSMEWFQKAAAAGSAEAMDRIGFQYETGEGVPTSKSQARMWYNKALAAGYARAAAHLKDL